MPPAYVIQRLGHWSSDAYLRYLRESRESMTAMFRASLTRTSTILLPRTTSLSTTTLSTMTTRTNFGDGNDYCICAAGGGLQSDSLMDVLHLGGGW